MRRILITAGAACLLAGAAFAQTADADVKAAIEEQVTRFEAAYNSGDADALGELYTEDAAVLPPGSARQDGRDAIGSVWSGAMDSGMKDLDLTVEEVHASGNMATEIGTFTAKAPAAEGGGQSDVAGKYIVLWQRGDDGTWRLHRDIWNVGQ